MRLSSAATGNQTGESNFDVKSRLLDNALRNVITMGWTDAALAKAAEDIGLSPMSHSLVNRGAVEVVEHFLNLKRAHVNTLMAPSINNEISSALHESNTTDGHLKRERILFKAIGAHIDYIGPYLQSWPAALALLAEPQNVASTLGSVKNITDDLCQYCDVKTTRMDWYIERCLLASLYCSTELFLLTDASPNFVESKEFLSKAIKIYTSARSENVSSFALDALAIVPLFSDQLLKMRNAFVRRPPAS